MDINTQMNGIVFPNDVLSIISKSKTEAKKQQVLFHCTKTEAFLNIVCSREFWLGNLKCVNDKEEAESIVLPQYISSFFVASFTIKNNVESDHWKEYASLDDGILFSVSPNWFYRNATFMAEDKSKIEYPIYNDAGASEKEFERIIRYMPIKEATVFGLFDFDFYKVFYSDEKQILLEQKGFFTSDENKELMIPIDFIVPNIAGIFKKREGLCRRTGCNDYIKNWEREEEVRLKIRIQKYMSDVGVVPLSKFWANRAAVKLTENAFDVCQIRFSPEYPEDKKISTLIELKKISPQTKFKILA